MCESSLRAFPLSRVPLALGAFAFACPLVAVSARFAFACPVVAASRVHGRSSCSASAVARASASRRAAHPAARCLAVPLAVSRRLTFSLVPSILGVNSAPTAHTVA